MADVTCGRFNISMKLVEDHGAKYGQSKLVQMANREPKQLSISTGSVQHMPIENPNFEWRIRADLRCGVDLPFNSVNPNSLPSVYCEVAWSESLRYEEHDFFTKQYSVIVPDNRHPHWNHQLILTNPHG